jgi:hypothetical protein
MTAAMNQWDGKSIDALEPLVLKNGGSAQAIMGLKQKSLDMKAKYSQIAKDDAATGTSNITTLMKKNDAVAGALGSILQAPDEQLPQALNTTAQQLAQQGLIDPQHVQLAQQLAQSGDPAKIRQQLDIMRKGVTSNTQLLEESKNQATEDNQKAMRAQAETTAANTQAYRQATLAQGNQRLSIEGGRLAFETKKAGLTPDGTANPLAQAIATGHIVPERMSYLLSRNPDLIQGVMAVDPSFDVSKAQTYPTTYKDFTSGKTSIALNSGGTALTHLQELSAMNTDASHIPGTPAYNAYQNKADTVASELAKFYGDATIPAIASIKKTLTATLPGNRQAAIETQAKSMGDKLDAYQQTWENAAPSKAYQAPMPGISPKALAARAALDPTYKAPSAGASQPVQSGSAASANDPFAQFGGKAH